MSDVTRRQVMKQTAAGIAVAGAAAGTAVAGAAAGTAAEMTFHVQIVSRLSGQVLDVQGASLNPGTPIIQYPWHGGPNQQWRLYTGGSGIFSIVSQLSGQVLDVRGASQNPGTPIIQYPSHGGANQQWQLILHSVAI